mmetsp:Transcript_17210/g.20863  ORF Transcript_17210/g.20863 Transcript_17210/m.20863 type:complete len:635 (-) Transcript_17210:1484-3388(-)|eukprot:CAMPEP_0184021802 /NCGR_PEP_ID=MMETSP0954-20121128/10161_1 /TAXON_ID=627963 /ORGANISM="Aplanochytrium sp, Strain PBS07" /LENGTH=634 /DNA_ID=CAMNT_0026303923 /DNA_START=90 /DNA_END=1994 /DNA_ORIENTATION=-
MENGLLKAALGAGLSLGAFQAVDSKYHISKDISTIRKIIPYLLKSKKLSEKTDWTVADQWEQVCDQQPEEKEALVFAEDGRSYSFREVEAYANQIARWAYGKGWKANDVVAIFVENRPEFVFALLGLAKVGIVAALINTNNKSKPLSHSIEIANCKAVIFGTELSENMATVMDELSSKNLPVFAYRNLPSDSVPAYATGCLDDEMKQYFPDRLPRSVRKDTGISSTFGYIYTSGTTGLPKACIIKHAKYITTSGAWGPVYGVKEDDRVYTVLPLYHSAGGMLGQGQLLTRGLTLILARKFSASKFFKNCSDYNATVTQYIGELARYLLNSPKSDHDLSHNVRIVIGNGLRREVWTPFLKRFGIPEVGEFYGATEGNIALGHHSQNFSGVGAVGHAGAILTRLQNLVFVKHDVETEEPVRGSDGFCIPCEKGEPGELLGYIDPADSTKEFAGYTSKEASEKKLMRNVLKDGDLYFRTGDLLRHDPDGWIYFVDRIGDTFRWKGENVSTNEVSEIVSVYDGILEANVYGVKVPGSEDGRACMVAVVMNEGASLDLDSFAQYLNSELATYAMPMFVRMLPQMDSTGTFKQRKVDLVKEGFNPAEVSDALYVYDLASKKYVPIDQNKYMQICNGQSRL